MYQQYIPKRPTIFTKVYEAILAERPSSLEEVKTINKETYTSIISCTDQDSTTKACTTEEWKSHDSPFVRT